MSWKLDWIQFENFRNLSQDKIHFSPRINCIFGENGNGKTNLLEGIFWTTNRKTFRKNCSFSHILSIDHLKPEIVFYSKFSNQKDKFSYNSKWEEKTKTYYWDGIKTIKKPPIYSVFINPFDSFLFHQQKTFRRSWLDDYLSPINPLYESSLKNYEKAKRQRKKILEKSVNLLELDQFEKIMASEASRIIQIRMKFLNDLNPLLAKSFKLLFSEDHQLKLELKEDWLNLDVGQIEKDLKDRRLKDQITKQTTRGIHRADIVFYFDHYVSFEYCSLGQQKMSFLSLIFSYIDLFVVTKEHKPLVLIDDVSGELDESRWSKLIDFLQTGDFQVFITTANSYFQNKLKTLNDSVQIYIKEGEIEAFKP